MSSVVCKTCNIAITTIAYVKCYNCNANYHFSPCCPLSKSTYSSMYGERKINWKCQIFKSRTKSANTMHQSVVYDEREPQIKLRANDEKNCEEDRANIHKDSLSLSTINSSLC